MAMACKNVAITLENWMVAAARVAADAAATFISKTGLGKLPARLITARVVLDAGILLQLS